MAAKISDFLAWLERAPKGDYFEYHRGFLCRDRSDKVIDRVAVVAAESNLLGHTALVQLRHGNFDYSYVAEKR